MTVTIDDAQIFNAITNAGYPAEATLLGSELCDAWVENCVEHDLKYKTLLLEAGFFIELDAQTYVVGACDRVMQDEDGVLVEESKSTSKSKTWTAERWFEALVAGHQLGTYGAALKIGTFIDPAIGPFPTCPNCKGSGEMDSGGVTPWGAGIDVRCNCTYPQEFKFNVEPRILVRAVTKSKPPEVWPAPEGQIVKIDQRKIDTTLNVYRNEAVAIRARRQIQLVPWMLPGKHCEKTYGFKTFICQHAKECKDGVYPVGDARVRPLGLSPGSDSVVDYLISSGRISLDKFSETVILSSSSLETGMQCMELWRRQSLGQERESKTSLDVGSVLHVGLAAYRRILQEQGY